MLIHPEGIPVGKVQRPHGFKGAMVVHFDNSQPELYTQFSHFFFQIDADLVPFKVKKLSHRHDGRAYLELEDVTDEATAKSLSGKAIMLTDIEVSEIPVQANEEDDSYLDWVIILKDGMVLGRVTNVNDYSGNVVLEIDYHGKEVLLPLAAEYVILEDAEKQELTLTLPEGLLEIYLND